MARNYTHRSKYDGNAARKTERELKRSKAAAKDNIVHIAEDDLYKSRRKTVNKPLYIRFFVCAVIVFTLCASIVQGQMEIMELNVQLDQAEARLSELQNTQIQMEMQYLQEHNEEDIRNYAEHTLGMRPIESGQITYIDLSGGNHGVVYEHPTPWEAFLAWINSFGK